MKINLDKGFHRRRPMNLRTRDPSLFDLGEIRNFFFSFHGQIELTMAVLRVTRVGRWSRNWGNG